MATKKNTNGDITIGVWCVTRSHHSFDYSEVDGVYLIGSKDDAKRFAETMNKKDEDSSYEAFPLIIPESTT